MEKIVTFISSIKRDFEAAQEHRQRDSDFQRFSSGLLRNNHEFDYRSLIEKYLHDADFFLVKSAAWYESSDLDLGGTLTKHRTLLELMIVHHQVLGSGHLEDFSLIAKAQKTAITNDSRRYLAATINSSCDLGLLKLILDPKDSYYCYSICWHNRHNLCLLYNAGIDINATDENGIPAWEGMIRQRSGWLLQKNYLGIFKQLVELKKITIEKLTSVSLEQNIEFFWKLVDASWAEFKVARLSNCIYGANSLKRLHSVGRLDPSFMVTTFDHLKISHSYTELERLVTELVDAFAFLNTKDFNFIDYRGEDGKTIVDKLREIGYLTALKIIDRGRSTSGCFIIENISASPRAIKELPESSTQRTCVICLERTANRCLIGCRHFGFCKSCITKCKNCPICKQEFTSEQIIELYCA